MKLIGSGGLTIGGAGLLNLLAGNTKVIELEAKERTLTVHGPRGRGTITLDAGSGSFQIQKANGETMTIPGMLRLDDGRLRLGSDANGSGNKDGSLRLRNAAGKTAVLINAGDNSLRLMNAQGQESLRLAGNEGDLIFQNADCAEEFDIASEEKVVGGTVIVLNDEGRLHHSNDAYDKRVAGVVSGAGQYKPGIILDRQPGTSLRQPIALMGKVFCRVDAQQSPIAVGDLLTTSQMPGHAMKAVDPIKAFGAVLGKALKPLEDGVGMIPILVSLQ